MQNHLWRPQAVLAEHVLDSLKSLLQLQPMTGLPLSHSRILGDLARTRSRLYLQAVQKMVILGDLDGQLEMGPDFVTREKARVVRIRHRHESISAQIRCMILE